MTSHAAVRAAVLTAAALRCENIAPVSRFERKHYHYADLPFGYQVTQQRWPIARNGSILAQTQLSSGKPNNKKKKKKGQASPAPLPPVGIDRIQLEQDTGKTTTSTRMSTDGTSTTTSSLVDFNRAGCSLVEIVMHPDIRSSQHAAATVETLRQLLKHIGTCNGKMEEGSLRVDLNVSIHPLQNDDTDGNSGKFEFQANMNNRVEVKNLNSLRQVVQAADYESIRQAKIVAGDEDDNDNTDEPITFQETRTFHVKSGKTVLIRSKEGDEDYRFMPEPDLPPVLLDEVLEGLSLDDFLAQNLPELPEAARERLQQDYQLDAYTASVIASDPPAIRLYDEAVQAAKDNLQKASSTGNNDSSNLESNTKEKEVPSAVANLLCNELFSLIREELERRRELEAYGATTTNANTGYSAVSGKQLGDVVALQLEGTISTTMSRKLLGVLFKEESEHNRDPSVVADERGWQLISDAEALQEMCRETLRQHPESLEQYQQGGKHVMKMKKFLVGKAMAHSQGNAHPERLHEALEAVLEEVAPGVE